MAGLLYSAARNAGRRLTANEVRQLFTMTADDIDFLTAKPPAPAANFATSQSVASRRFPSIPGYDEYFGYGRVNADRMVRAVAGGNIPPEAEITDPDWYTIVSPADGRLVVRGRVDARHARSYGYEVSVGRGTIKDPGAPGFGAPNESPLESEMHPLCSTSRAPLGTPRGALLGLDRAPARGAREPAHERAARHPGRQRRPGPVLVHDPRPGARRPRSHRRGPPQRLPAPGRRRLARLPAPPPLRRRDLAAARGPERRRRGRRPARHERRDRARLPRRRVLRPLGAAGLAGAHLPAADPSRRPGLPRRPPPRAARRPVALGGGGRRRRRRAARGRGQRRVRLRVRVRPPRAGAAGLPGPHERELLGGALQDTRQPHGPRLPRGPDAREPRRQAGAGDRGRRASTATSTRGPTTDGRCAASRCSSWTRPRSSRSTRPRTRSPSSPTPPSFRARRSSTRHRSGTSTATGATTSWWARTRSTASP